MHKVTLDENIIRFAAEQKNEYGNDDWTCFNILTSIGTRCDEMYYSDELLKKYHSHLNPSKKVSGGLFLKLLEYLKIARKLKRQ